MIFLWMLLAAKDCLVEYCQSDVGTLTLELLEAEETTAEI